MLATTLKLCDVRNRERYELTLQKHIKLQYDNTLKVSY